MSAEAMLYRKQVASTSAFNSAARNLNPFNQMKCPKLLGSINNVSLFTALDTVTNNVQTYGISYPFSGVNADYAGQGLDGNGFYKGSDYTLGSNFFQDIGTCSEESESPCAGMPRSVYVRNIPTGKVPILGNISFQGMTGCNLTGLTENRGILSGMLEDISDMQPGEILGAIQGEKGNFGTYRCKAVSYPVGSKIYDPAMREKTWKNITRCTPSYFNWQQSTTGQSQVFPTGSALMEGFNGKISRRGLLLLLLLLLLVVVLGLRIIFRKV